jgi:hypothetical protein
LWFLKIPPLAAVPGLPKDEPSVLHFTQPDKGGFQITSMILGALG